MFVRRPLLPFFDEDDEVDIEELRPWEDPPETEFIPDAPELSLGDLEGEVAEAVAVEAALASSSLL